MTPSLYVTVRAVPSDLARLISALQWDNMPSTNRRRRQTPSDYSIDVARELSAALEALKIRTHDPSPTQTLRRERDCQPALPPLDKTTQPPGDQLTVRLHEAERRAVRRVRGRHKDVEQGRQLLQDFLDQTREDRGLPVLDGETLNAPVCPRSSPFVVMLLPMSHLILRGCSGTSAERKLSAGVLCRTVQQ